MFKRLSLIVLLLLQFFCISAKLQNAATEQSEQRKTSKPYTGDLSIFDSPGSDERLQINRVMDILGIAPGKTVADIGAGSGWFTVRAAKRVRDTGTVYAVDINPAAIRYIESRIRKENLRNVKPIVARDIVIREANAAGYQLLEQDDFVKDGTDYFLVFGAK